MSLEYINYLKKKRIRKYFILFMQIGLIVFLFLLWEILARLDIINTFITSSPSLILENIIKLYNDNNLFKHIYITCYEIIISFSLSMLIGFIIALIFYLLPIIKEILDPLISLFNSLPKVAFGPLIIIWFGANLKSIIFNSLLISLIVTFTTILNGFNKTDEEIIKLFKIYHASRKDLIIKLIIPSSFKEIISAAKLNLGLTFIGVIMGEFLSCKAGIGYLILYGSQVFNLSLVMCSIFILLILSFIFYLIINLIDKKLGN